ncbi:hypothetical protein FHG87_023172, partial [Trinorchestia longiramus]
GVGGVGCGRSGVWEEWDVGGGLQHTIVETEEAVETASSSVSQSDPYRPPGGVDEMQGGGRRVRLEWGAYITV